jgi:hypothetical protein
MKEAFWHLRTRYHNVPPDFWLADVSHTLLTDTHVPISLADVLAEITSNVISGSTLKRQNPSESGTLTEPCFDLLTWISLQSLAGE